MRRLLVDGDWLLFRGAAAAQRNVYAVRAVPLTDLNAPGKVVYLPENWRDAQKWMKSDEAAVAHPDSAFVLDVELEVEPVSHAFQNLNGMLDNAVDKTDASEIKLFIKNPDERTFRYLVDPQYKANRIGADKPFLYDECVWYLNKKYEPVTARAGLEVDDELGILQWEDYLRARNIADKRGWQYVYKNNEARTCICTVDKDLDVIPGWHYNPTKQEVYWVTEEQAKRAFYKQVLTGDTSDNVKGLDRVGPKTAEKLLDGVKISDLEARVLEEYRTREGPDGELRMRTNQALVYILRNFEEMHHDWFNGEPESLEVKA